MTVLQELLGIKHLRLPPATSHRKPPPERLAMLRPCLTSAAPVWQGPGVFHMPSKSSMSTMRGYPAFGLRKEEC